MPIVLTGSKGLLLVVKNEGEVTLKVNVQVPNDLINDFPAFEVTKHDTKRVWLFIVCGCPFSLLYMYLICHI